MQKGARMNTAKQLLLQYDFKTAIPLIQAVRDYYNSTMKDKQIFELASQAKFPFPVYKADPKNKKSEWFVNLEDLASWLDKRKLEAQKDWQNMQ